MIVCPIHIQVWDTREQVILGNGLAECHSTTVDTMEVTIIMAILTIITIMDIPITIITTACTDTLIKTKLLTRLKSLVTLVTRLLY